MLTEAVDHEGQIDFPRHVYRSSRAACHPTERWGGSTGGCLLTLPSSHSSPGSFEVWQPGPTWLAHVAAVFTNTVTGWRVPHGRASLPRHAVCQPISRLQQSQQNAALTEAAGAFRFAHFTFRQHTVRRFRARLSTVSQK